MILSFEETVFGWMLMTQTRHEVILLIIEQSIVSYFVVELPQRIRNICLLAAVVAGE